MSLEHDKTKCEETLQATLTKLHEAERQIDHFNLEKEQLFKDIEHICMEKEEFKVYIYVPQHNEVDVVQ